MVVNHNIVGVLIGHRTADLLRKLRWLFRKELLIAGRCKRGGGRVTAVQTYAESQSASNHAIRKVLRSLIDLLSWQNVC